MIIFETMGIFIVALGCMGALTLFGAFFICGTKMDEESIVISFFGVIVALLFIVSIFFVQFRHYPEKFGYTAIEEVEEVEESEN